MKAMFTGGSAILAAADDAVHCSTYLHHGTSIRLSLFSHTFFAIERLTLNNTSYHRLVINDT